jgi:hypothetical protein
MGVWMGNAQGKTLSLWEQVKEIYLLHDDGLVAHVCVGAEQLMSKNKINLVGLGMES